jgi:Fe-S-cluster containining protein
MILLLKSDAEKISQKTLKRLNEFTERAEGQEPYVYLMRKTLDGKCFFLKDSLCAVYEMRPLVCRFYPFKLDHAENGIYIFSCTEECPGIGSGPRLGRKFYDTLFAEFVASMG